MTSDPCFLGEMQVDLLGSTLSSSVALIRDLQRGIYILDRGEQLLLPRLEFLGLLDDPDRSLNLLLQLFNFGRLEP